MRILVGVENVLAAGNLDLFVVELVDIDIQMHFAHRNGRRLHIGVSGLKRAM